MTAKPIVVVYFPKEDWEREREKYNAQRYLDESKKDYHWFILPDYDAEKIEMKVFYEKDFTPIQYEELKTMIQEAINQQQKQGE